MASPNSTFTEIVSTTLREHKKSLADNVSNNNALWRRISEKGRIQVLDGGYEIVEPLDYAENSTYQRYSGYDVLNVSASDVISAAKFDWKQSAVHVTASGLELRQNAGKNQIINLAKARITNAMRTFANNLSSDMYSDGTTSNQMGGLQAVISDAGTGTVGGIDSATNDWWRNQEIDFDADVSGIFVDEGQKTMSEMLNNCSNNLRQDTPDLILSGQNPYEEYEELSLVYQRIVNKELADAGFTHQVFKGIPMVWSPACAGTRMYFINTRFLRLKYDPQMNFDMTEWKAIPDQIQDRAAQIIFAGNLTTNRRKVHGVIHSIDS